MLRPRLWNLSQRQLCSAPPSSSTWGKDHSFDFASVVLPTAAPATSNFRESSLKFHAVSPGRHVLLQITSGIVSDFNLRPEGSSSLPGYSALLTFTLMHLDGCLETSQPSPPCQEAQVCAANKPCTTLAQDLPLTSRQELPSPAEPPAGASPPGPSPNGSRGHGPYKEPHSR